MKAWWPSGYGKPVLYDAAVIFTDSRGGPVDEYKFQIGFRTVQLVQQTVSAHQPGLFRRHSLLVYLFLV